MFAASDRYFAIAFPFKYRRTNTVKLAKAITAIIWVLSTLGVLYTENRAEFTNDLRMVLLQAKTWHNKPRNDSINHKVMAVTLFLLFGLLWILTLLTLHSIYSNFKKSQKLNKKAKNASAHEKQMAIVLVAMVVAFTFSMSPTIYHHVNFFVHNNILGCIYYFHFKDFFMSTCFLYTNSAWNFLIYNLLNKKFRLELRKLFKKQF